MGIVLAYAVLPVVIGVFMEGIKDSNLAPLNLSSVRRGLLMGLVLSVLVLFDQRIAYIAILTIGLYWLVFISAHFHIKQVASSVFYTFILPFLTTLFLHTFWILPLIFSGKEANYISEQTPTVGEATFFSFATLSNSISLLHPNWPENIFGKVSFMQPEFLIIPIVAFSLLLFSRAYLGHAAKKTGKNMKKNS